MIDFRPYAANTAAYATSIGTASVNPNTAVTFGTSDIFIPAPNEAFETDYEYYLGRKDHFMIDGDGRFVVVYGEPDERPSPPSAPSTGMVLATLNVPPFPSLPPLYSPSPSPSSFRSLSLASHSLFPFPFMTFFLSTFLPAAGRLLARPDFQVRSKAQPAFRPCVLCFFEFFSYLQVCLF